MSLKIPLKYSMIWQSYANDRPRIARSGQKEADWLVFHCFYDNRGRIFKFCLLIDLHIKIKEITD